MNTAAAVALDAAVRPLGLEVMTVADRAHPDPSHPDPSRPGSWLVPAPQDGSGEYPVDLARLLGLADLAGRESEVLDDLRSCLDRWSDVEAAKTVLAALPAEQLRALLNARHRHLVQDRDDPPDDRAAGDGRWSR